MTIRTRTWRDGIPCWVELVTEDFAQAHRFYAPVLGWTDSREPEDGSRYTVVEQREVAVAGFRRNNETEHAGWAVYIAVADVDLKAAEASARGIAVVVPPEDQLGSGPGHVLGRRAVVNDPSGAPVGLWQGLALNGCQLVNEPGGLCFEELSSPDPAAAGFFLESLFGYLRTSEPTLGPEYSTFQLPDETFPLGGVRALTAEDPIGGGWRPFFGVTSANEACEEAARRGGRVVVRPFIWAGNEEIALLTDPEGFEFGVVTSTGEGQPDRR